MQAGKPTLLQVTSGGYVPLASGVTHMPHVRAGLAMVVALKTPVDDCYEHRGVLGCSEVFNSECVGGTVRGQDVYIAVYAETVAPQVKTLAFRLANIFRVPPPEIVYEEKKEIWFRASPTAKLRSVFWHLFCFILKIKSAFDFVCVGDKQPTIADIVSSLQKSEVLAAKSMSTDYSVFDDEFFWEGMELLKYPQAPTKLEERIRIIGGIGAINGFFSYVTNFMYFRVKEAQKAKEKSK